MRLATTQTLIRKELETSKTLNVGELARKSGKTEKSIRKALERMGFSLITKERAYEGPSAEEVQTLILQGNLREEEARRQRLSFPSPPVSNAEIVKGYLREHKQGMTFRDAINLALSLSLGLKAHKC